MNNKILALQKAVGELMQHRIGSQDFTALAELAPVVTKLESLSKRQSEIDVAVSEIDGMISGLKKGRHTTLEIDSGESKSKARTLRISIDWSANDRKNRPVQEVNEHTAASTMVSFIELMIKEFGEAAIEKLMRLRINRGPLISKSPERDFKNSAQGTLYGHKRIAGSDWHVLTHSSTPQKINDLKRVCDVLGIRKDSVKIAEVDRWDRLVADLL